jgi:hypothetical protein
MAQMNTRGIRVDAHAGEPKKTSKTLFPWRDLGSGPIAKALLVKHVLERSVEERFGCESVYFGDSAK